MKKLSILGFLLLSAVGAHAQFVPGQAVTASALNSALANPTIVGGSITGVPISGGSVSGTSITGGTLDNTPVGNTTTNSGKFTTLTASGGINSTAIGATTPSTGVFTQLTSSGGIATAYSSDTGSPAAGVRYYLDNLWSPPGNLSQLNNFLQIHMPADSLTGGTVQQRWFSSNQLILVDVQTTGPSGSPSSPSGMADSHTIGIESVETIPAGLCDGMNGSGFTGPGGSPGNNCYQEIGGLASVNTILSPGHYAEGIASNINDNNGGAGVPIRANGMLSNISKNSATNTYTTYGYNANSIGTQQTTNSPTAAYHVDGGWQTSLDLSANTNAGAVSIKLPSGQTINSDSNNIYFGVNSTQSLSLNATSSTLTGGLTINDPSGSTASSLRVSATSSTNGANIVLAGNGGVTPTKALNVTSGTFNILNNAYSANLMSLTDSGNATFLGTVSGASFPSPSLTGTPTAPTATAGTNTTQVATTAFVQAALPAGYTSYTPTISASSGTYTSASATGGYSKTGKLVCFWATATITTVGTGTSTVLGLPFATASTNGGVTVFPGRENASTGKMLQGFAPAGSSTMTIFDYSNVSAAASGASEVMSGCYISQ